MDLIICLVMFMTVTILVQAIYKRINRYDVCQKRLRSLQDTSPEGKTAKMNYRQIAGLLTGKFTHLFAFGSLTGKIQNDLIKADIPLKGEEYICICLGLVTVLPLLIFILTRNVAAAVVILICGLFLPRVYMKHKKELRLRNINKQLGDALVVMANALRAGFGFQQAMDTVRKELPPPIATEFAWTLRETNLGFSHEEALLNLGKRVGSQDLDMIITAIIIQRQVGGNLAEILDNISNTIRDRAKIKQEIKVLTAQGRLSGLIVGLLPIILIAAMLMINPAYFNVMVTDIRGITVLATALGLEMIGILIIRRIINIDL